jgi:hypothetical protein
MKRLLILLILFFAIACNDNPPPSTLEKKLASVMTDYLYKVVQYDSSKVKYHVERVVYYADKTKYDCEFTVRMMIPGRKDTTGFMKAYISKDFKKVNRTY